MLGSQEEVMAFVKKSAVQSDQRLPLFVFQSLGHRSLSEASEYQ
jgi:hypothetical protein